MAYDKSIAAFEEAYKVIPGGVDSPVRAFSGVEGTPPFIERGEGGHLFDIDGNKYIDYVQSWGPLIFGHCDADIETSVFKASILFSKASAMYSQLRYINSKEHMGKYKKLLDKLDLLYGSDNTKMHREQLQDFIDEYSEDIYKKSLELGDDKFWLE